MSLDQTDKDILKLLKTNGRMSYRQISQKTGPTPPTIKSRIDSLIENGIIEKFTVEINHHKLRDQPLTRVLITLTTDPTHLETIYQKLNNQDNVQKTYKTANSNITLDYIGTQTELRNFINNLPETVTNTDIQIILEKH